MSFSDQEIEEFKTEARELLDVAESSLLALDHGTDFKQTYDAVFRSLHNLKGASGMMEMHALQTHTHELENVFMPFKDQPSMGKNYVSYFLRGIDAARVILDGGKVEFDYRGYEEKAPQPEETMSSQDDEKPEALPVIEAEQTVGSSGSEEIVEINTNTEPKVEGPSKLAVAEFVAESEEILGRVSTNLRELENGSTSRDVVDELYRDIHSLKGSSFLFGFQQMGEIAHAMESAMEPVRDQTHKPSKFLIDGLYKAVAALELDIECTKQEVSNDQLKALAPALIRILNGALKSLQPISSSAGAETDSAPAVSTPIPQPQVEASGAVAMVAQPIKAEVIEAASASPGVGSSESSTTTQTETLAISAVATSPTSSAPSSTASAEAPKESDLGGSIRVPVALLDNLMTLMGEMVLVRNQVLQFSNKTEDLEFLNLSQRLNVVTSELQGEMMKTRMQPIGNVMSKFHRVVRDLGQELKKSIQFTIEGAETELDKSLLEAIKDPLTHIVRNSCDHGIEMPEVRRQAGKSEQGHIHVRAFHEGGQVVIEIVDDGKGLNRETLITKGIERGLVDPSQAKQMSDKEVFNLIFAPGFSTAAKITNVSGRGVGMDVVRTNVEKIGGSVDLTSVYGAGTTIRLKIPLTLAIVPALIVHSGGKESGKGGRFAIPQVKLVELVRVDQTSQDNKIEWLQGVPVYRLRGNILPLVDLNSVLRLGGESLKEKSIVNIAVLSADAFQFGLIVDEIQDTADIVVKPLSRLMKSLNVYSGATILGDGSVALILDVLGLAKVANLRSEGAQDRKVSNASTQRNESAREGEPQDYLLIKVGAATKHAMVLGYVHRLEEFQQSQIDVTGQHRVVRYRDAILPLASVNKQLGLKEKTYQPGESVSVVVVERGGQLFGLEVDDILDTLSSGADVDRSLDQGGVIVGNIAERDELIVVIDPFQVIGRTFGGESRQKALSTTFSVGSGSESVPSVQKSQYEILLAEDTPFFRRIVKDVLEQHGYKVTVANDGVEAWESIKSASTQFDLLLTDIEMPRMNGFELAKTIRANSKFRELPILALSSRFDSKYTNEAARVGIDHYLEKMKPEVLIEAIQTLVTRKVKRGAA